MILLGFDNVLFSKQSPWVIRKKMVFREKIDKLDLSEFKPGIMSRAEFGKGLTTACMEITLTAIF